jgi:hypothetical protein
MAPSASLCNPTDRHKKDIAETLLFERLRTRLFDEHQEFAREVDDLIEV